MNLISALQAVQSASKSDVVIVQSATLCHNANPPLLTLCRVSTMVPHGEVGLPAWTSFEGPNLEAATARALEALKP